MFCANFTCVRVAELILQPISVSFLLLLFGLKKKNSSLLNVDIRKHTTPAFDEHSHTETFVYTFSIGVSFGFVYKIESSRSDPMPTKTEYFAFHLRTNVNKFVHE